MKQKRIAELVKAAKQRVNGPPGSRQIILLPEEVLELLEDGLKVESSGTGGIADVMALANSQALVPDSLVTASVSGAWDAVGRIAAAFIGKQPPNVKASLVADYVTDVIRDVRQKAEI